MCYICWMNSENTVIFYKYQGTGNDFIMVDNRDNTFPKDDIKFIGNLCDRKFGIGADGLILLENDNKADFKMVYFNSDGNESTMCGNGGRCIVAFAHNLNIISEETTFNAIDGLHEAKIDGDTVILKMIDVGTVKELEKYSFLNTGSPHHVQLVNELDKLNVPLEGARLRYGIYGQQGSNINFVEQKDKTTFRVRTYERGVEDETLSCGTGVVAVALAMHSKDRTKSNHISIETIGGDLEVNFKKNGNGYQDIYLSGPANFVFKGEIAC